VEGKKNHHPYQQVPLYVIAAFMDDSIADTISKYESPPTPEKAPQSNYRTMVSIVGLFLFLASGWALISSRF
jgi:hypothetical protein